MQIMGASSRQAVGLLLLLLVVAVPSATAQGRSNIRIVECINESIGNISLNLDTLRGRITATTTLKPTTTPETTTMNTMTPETTTMITTDEGGAIFGRLRLLDQASDKSSWLMLDAVDLAVPQRFSDETLTLDCGNNTNCEKLVFALEEADAVAAEVNGDKIYEAQVDRIYKADADVVKVVFNATIDLELHEILHDNIDYLDNRMEMLKADKADMQDLQDKMKTKETLAMVFGLIAGLLAFIGLTSAGYACYQKIRKDPGVPEGLIIEATM